MGHNHMKVRIIEASSVSRVFGKRFLEGRMLRHRPGRMRGWEGSGGVQRSVKQSRVKEPCALWLGDKKLGTFDDWVAATKIQCREQGIQWLN